MKNIVLLSYGNQVEYHRAVYTILSLLAWYKEPTLKTRILVCTDNPGIFKQFLSDFEIHYVQLTDIRLMEMLGGADYIHRRKICILQEVFRLFPEDDILYVDSDTFFVADPAALLDHICSESNIMHIREYRLEHAPKIYREIMSDRLPNAEEFPKAFLKFIDHHEISVANRKLSFKPAQFVWNAGVIGIDNQMLPMLDDILAFNDQIFPQTKWFISEQLSFALILQSFRTLQPACATINHYYQCKRVVDVFTKKTLGGNFLTLTTSEKLARVKTSTAVIDKLSRLDFYISISRGSFGRKEFRKGIKYAVRAFNNIPMYTWTFEYFKTKFLNEQHKRKMNV